MESKDLLYVLSSDFKDTSNMVTPVLEGKKWDVSSKKAGTAYQIAMDYNYPKSSDDDETIQKRLMIKTPRLTTSRGIQDHKEFVGKPAICVRFDLKNPEHKHFIGEFGTKYEYDRKGNHVDKEHTPSTGVLSSLYDWSIYQIGRHIAKLDDRDDPDDNDFFEATKMISKNMFFYRRKYTKKDAEEGNGKCGEIVPGADPLKFFKLQAYTGMDDTGKPLPTKYTDFMMASGKQVPISFLYDKSFDFTGVLSFRRIYLGARNSVTMELTHCIIHKFNESISGISRITSRLLTENKESNPEEADLVEKQYAEMLGKSSQEVTKSVLSRDVDRFANDDDNNSDVSEDREDITFDETERNVKSEDESSAPVVSRRRRIRQTSD